MSLHLICYFTWWCSTTLVWFLPRQAALELSWTFPEHSQQKKKKKRNWYLILLKNKKEKILSETVVCFYWDTSFQWAQLWAETEILQAAITRNADLEFNTHLATSLLACCSICFCCMFDARMNNCRAPLLPQDAHRPTFSVANHLAVA